MAAVTQRLLRCARRDTMNNAAEYLDAAQQGDHAVLADAKVVACFLRGGTHDQACSVYAAAQHRCVIAHWSQRQPQRLQCDVRTIVPLGKQTFGSGKRHLRGCIVYAGSGDTNRSRGALMVQVATERSADDGPATGHRQPL